VTEIPLKVVVFPVYTLQPLALAAVIPSWDSEKRPVLAPAPRTAPPSPFKVWLHKRLDVRIRDRRGALLSALADGDHVRILQRVQRGRRQRAVALSVFDRTLRPPPMRLKRSRGAIPGRPSRREDWRAAGTGALRFLLLSGGDGDGLKMVDHWEYPGARNDPP
jgi:hypothetical protein